MCGIAGVLTADGGAAGMMPAVEIMRDAVAHRGPDDRGTWRSTRGAAAFAHTRLSILDLTPAGHQPMATADGRFTITFNGEIFNFRELRRSLQGRGATFTTQSDTEVILQAYALDGPGFVERLRGMFAMAIWDEREQTCLIARDRFGIKPFYYHTADGRLTFASEVRALIASGLVPTELDAVGLFGYFRTGTVPEPRTLLKNVCTLEAGHYAIWKNGALTSTRYWELHFANTLPAGTDFVETARSALLDSVEHHFVSDRPVGVFLSGGFDSTALVALATRAGQRDLHTFSMSFPGLPEDEGAIARRTAEHFGTTHAEWPIDAALGKQLFADFLKASDQPSIDGLNTFAVSRFASERGMKVVLSGLGGDELFAGYKSFDEVPAMNAWNRRLSYAGPIRDLAGRGLERLADDPRWRRVGDLLQQQPDLASAYATFRGVFTRSEADALVRSYTGQARCATRANGEARPHDPTPRDAISRLELTHYMRNQPLRDSDTMSMAWGLELRVPFLDGLLVDTLAAIPAAVRLQPGKRFLLQAVPEIPEWVAAQPKRGFMFPFQRWLDDEWREMFSQIDRQSPVPTQTWYRKWCVFVLDRWLDRLTVRPHE